MTKETSEFFASLAKATEVSYQASYQASLLIHSIGQTLIKPAAKVMTNKMFGENVTDETARIPLSNDTIWQHYGRKCGRSAGDTYMSNSVLLTRVG